MTAQDTDNGFGPEDAGAVQLAKAWQERQTARRPGCNGAGRAPASPEIPTRQLPPRVQQAAYDRWIAAGGDQDAPEAEIDFERYVTDQLDLARAMTAARKRRSTGLVPSGLRWASHAIKAIHDQIVEDGKAWHEALGAWVLARLDTVLRTVPRFLWAHAPATATVIVAGVLWALWGLHWSIVFGVIPAGVLLTYVPRAEWGRRRARCARCTFRSVEDGHAFCGAENGGRGCKCWRSRLWPAGWLDYKCGLRLWRCEIGAHRKGAPKGA